MTIHALCNELRGRITQIITRQVVSDETGSDNLESKMTIIELQSLIEFHGHSEDTQPFQNFLNNRWERIVNTNRIYPSQPEHPINQLCIRIAETLNQMTGIGRYQLLMPSITHLQNEVTGTSLNDADLQLWQFVLSDDNSRFIEVEWCLVSAKDFGLLRQNSLLNNEHELLLSDTEKQRVISHSTTATAYYNSILQLVQRRSGLERPSIGATLEHLIASLRRGGVNGGHDGEEYNAGHDANFAILEFYDYWNPIEETKKAEYNPLNDPHAPNVTLGELCDRLFNPGNYRQTIYCVQVIANHIDSILQNSLHLYDEFPNLSLASDRLEVVIQKRNQKEIEFTNAINSPTYEVTSHYPPTALPVRDLITLNQNQFRSLSLSFLNTLIGLSPQDRLQGIIDIMLNRNETDLFTFLGTLHLLNETQRKDLVREISDSRLRVVSDLDGSEYDNMVWPFISQEDRLTLTKKINLNNLRQAIEIKSVFMSFINALTHEDDQKEFFTLLGEECLKRVIINMGENEHEDLINKLGNSAKSLINPMILKQDSIEISLNRDQPQPEHTNGFLLAKDQWEFYVKPMRQYFDVIREQIEQGDVTALERFLGKNLWEEMLEHKRTLSYELIWEKMSATELAIVNMYQFVLDKLNSHEGLFINQRFISDIRIDGEEFINALTLKYKNLCTSELMRFLPITISASDFYHIFNSSENNNDISQQRYQEICTAYLDRLQSVHVYENFKNNMQQALGEVIAVLETQIDVSPSILKRYISNTLQKNQSEMVTINFKLNAKRVISSKYLESYQSIQSERWRELPQTARRMILANESDFDATDLIKLPTFYIQEKGSFNQLIHYAVLAYQNSANKDENRYLQIIEALYKSGDYPWELNAVQQNAFTFGGIEWSQGTENEIRKQWQLMQLTIANLPVTSPIIAQLKKDITAYTNKTSSMMNSFWKRMIAHLFNYNITTRDRLSNMHEISKELWTSLEKYNDEASIGLLKQLSTGFNTGIRKKSQLKNIITHVANDVDSHKMPLVANWDTQKFDLYVVDKKDKMRTLTGDEARQMSAENEIERLARTEADQRAQADRQAREAERQAREEAEQRAQADRQAREEAEQRAAEKERQIQELQQQLSALRATQPNAARSPSNRP